MAARALLTLVCFIGLLPPVRLDAAADMEMECHVRGRAWQTSDSATSRQYAPDRKIDILHLALDVTPDFKQRSVSGRAILTFKPIALPLRELRLDAVDLAVESVTASARIRAHQNTGDALIVTFEEAIAPDTETRVEVVYRATPDRGLYFRTPEMGYKAGETHLFTQGEAIEARHWYPCHDAPNEKFTSEITCRVPEGMTVISNGRRMSSEADSRTGLTAVRWLQDKPHVNYLLALIAGYFKGVEERYKDIPLGFHTLPSEIDQAMNSFQDTRDMMAFFEEEIGVPYPWAKYDQVCVNDFVAGGMENTTLTILTDRTLFTSATETLTTSQGLVAHELAHQWFGNLVTCKDWSHLWLNEGFATYYDALYDGHKNGPDSMRYVMLQNARKILDRTDDTNAIVRRTYEQPLEMFNYLAYPKGAWVLHMLRSQLGAELYRRCVRIYLERHQYGTVVTEDLNSVIEEVSGRSFDPFFDQWVYHARHPELEISDHWDEVGGLARITVRQTQATGPDVLLFQFPLAIRFKGAFGVSDHQVTIRNRQEDFYFPLASAPTVVRIDPDFTLLARIQFKLSEARLKAQIEDNQDMMGRILAVEQMADRRDVETVARLRTVLNNDPFHGVRIEASKALGTVHTDEALEALIASADQPDARVRARVGEDIARFYNESARDFALRALETEKNPRILAAVLRQLSAYPSGEVSNLFLARLDSESYRNELADGAVAAMKLQDDPKFLAPILDALGRHESRFTTPGYCEGLEAVGWLARRQDSPDEARAFLLARLNHPKQRVRVAAINALGTLGDPRALAALQTFAGAARETPERKAAESAIPKLGASRQQGEELNAVRQELIELQKTGRELRKEIEDLKKRVEAGGPKSADRPSE